MLLLMYLSLRYISKSFVSREQPHPFPSYDGNTDFRNAFPMDEFEMDHVYTLSDSGACILTDSLQEALTHRTRTCPNV